MILYYILAAIVWYSMGLASFIYWWTKDFEYDRSIFFYSLSVGIMGPVAFLSGYIIHGKKKKMRD